MKLLEIYAEDELRIIDVNRLGLTKKDWVKTRGARSHQEYLDDLGNVIVKEWYDYTYSSDDRYIVSYVRHIAFYNEDGTMIYDEPTTPDISSVHLKEINRSIRQGRIDYLEDAAENLREGSSLVPEPYKTMYITIANGLDTLFNHYNTHITEYTSRANLVMSFENAINNESDQDIIDILNLTARLPDAEFPNGLTVKQSILYQLTGVKP